MQKTLNKLVPRANMQDIDFNVNKCGVMHIREVTLKFQYLMNDGWVKSVDEERELEVLMSKDLKFSIQCYWQKIMLII